MRVRTVITAGVLAMATAAVPAWVLASTRSGEMNVPVAQQKVQYRTDNAFTNSTDWTYLNMVGSDGDGTGPVPGPERMLLVTRGAMTVTVSGDFRGAPVELRVNRGREVLEPGKTEFQGTHADSSFSYTFAGRGSRTPQCMHVGVEWRSPTGKKVVFERGSMVVTYKPEPLRDGSACID